MLEIDKQRRIEYFHTLKPFLQTLAAFIIYIRCPATRPITCYQVAGEFLKQLEKDLTE